MPEETASAKLPSSVNSSSLLFLALKIYSMTRINDIPLKVITHYSNNKIRPSSVFLMLFCPYILSPTNGDLYLFQSLSHYCHKTTRAECFVLNFDGGPYLHPQLQTCHKTFISSSFGARIT